MVEVSDIKGDIHVHSCYDLTSSHDLGSSSIEELLDTAAGLGYQYLGLSDHNPAMSKLSGSQIVEILHKRQDFFRKTHEHWQKKSHKKLGLFNLLEIDITPSGELALPADAFEYIDAAVVSLHSSFKQGRKEMTERILKGLSHPKAKIFGHPTGRLIGEREGVDANWQDIFEFCVQNNKALEINSWPARLDLPDLLVREAVKMGAKFVISTDTHQKEHLHNMMYGVDVARRGWVEAKNVLNTMEYNRFREWLLRD